MPKNLSAKDGWYWTSAMHGASTGRPQKRKTHSFASTVLPNTANGIWASTTKSPSRPRDTTNFPTGISERSTAVACSRQKAAPANISTMTSKMRPHTCMACSKPGSLRRLQSAHGQHLPADRRAGRGDSAAASAVHRPKHQAEQHAQEKTRHQREIERYIFPL